MITRSERKMCKKRRSRPDNRNLMETLVFKGMPNRFPMAYVTENPHGAEQHHIERNRRKIGIENSISLTL